MLSSDMHLAQGEAKETVMEQLAHVKLPTNSNKQYDHNEMIKLSKIVTRVLTETFNDKSNGKGMSELLESTKNVVNSVKTTQSISYMTVLKESKDKAAKSNKCSKSSRSKCSCSRTTDLGHGSSQGRSRLAKHPQPNYAMRN